MSKPDGGQAFPLSVAYREPGMSLRDYFAAQAMAACVGADSSTNQNYGANPEKVATYAYEFADAMLKEREK